FQFMFCSFSLPLLIRLAFLQSTTGAFLSLRSSDAEKKRRPRLGIFRYRENRLVSSASLLNIF
ncbi:hypothetical protein, partial [Leeuwenhoekiella sp. CH_XMU1409-2]|uniref:hypothetical protein n=1 Tax=Leeuwenhoekiella sp. CH_XMU1409-2 TaxID=3107768 RepID=UPI00300BE671